MFPKNIKPSFVLFRKKEPKVNNFLSSKEIQEIYSKFLECAINLFLFFIREILKTKFYKQTNSFWETITRHRIHDGVVKSISEIDYQTKKNIIKTKEMYLRIQVFCL